MCNYFVPDNWYDQEYEPENECLTCNNKDKVIEISKNYLHDIIKIIYGESDLDIALLDDYFIELCNQLDVDHSTKMPNIRRPDILKNWVENNNAYLKNLSQGCQK